MNLDYSNYFGRYQGNSATEVVAQIHADAQKVGPISYQDWKKWNQRLWQGRYGLDVPVEDTPEAEEGFLEVLVKVGAIHPTPSVSPSSAPTTST